MHSSIPQISIIVPIYNVEKYLNKCVESVLNQTFPDFELLLINDGSKDNSGRICDEYAEKDHRIRAFHKINGGVSSARNLGLEHAKGEWIMFVDADDWIEKDCLLVLYETCRSDDLDLLQFSFRTVNDKEETMNVYSEETPVMALKDYVERDVFLVCVGGSIIKKSIIDKNKLSFRNDLKLAEDQIFILSIMYHSVRIKRIRDVFYNYYQNDNSATANAKCHDIISSIIALNEFKYRDIFKKHIDRMIVVQTNVALNISKCNVIKLYQVTNNISINSNAANNQSLDSKFLLLFWNKSLFFPLIIIRIKFLVSHTLKVFLNKIKN